MARSKLEQSLIDDEKKVAEEEGKAVEADDVADPVEEAGETETLKEEAKAADAKNEKIDVKADPKPEEVKADEKTETKTDEDTPASRAALARMRREAAAAKREAESLRAAARPSETAPAKTAEPPKPGEADLEPNKAENYEGWLEWRVREADRKTGNVERQVQELADWRGKQEAAAQNANLWNEAQNELHGYVSAFKAKEPNYEPAMRHLGQEFKRSFKLLHPGATDNQISDAMGRTMIKFAAEAVARGLDPAEEMFGYAQEHAGWQPEAPKEAVTDKKGPSLKLVETRKAKSASPLGAGGKSGDVGLSLKGASEMTLGEFSKLSEAELDRLEKMEA